jgi:hypothetical protein
VPLSTNNKEIEMTMFENADTFLNANSELFTGLSESDLALPERLVFLKNEVVEGTVLDTSIIEKIGAVKLEVKIETGDHAGKLFELVQFKPKEREGKISPTQKKQWVEFLLAFFTKEEVLSGKVDFTKFIGSKLQFKAGEARDVGGKTYQNYNSYKLIDATPF